jgi:GntR family transcriptional regulator/MocR family aminotransferase
VGEHQAGEDEHPERHDRAAGDGHDDGGPSGSHEQPREVFDDREHQPWPVQVRGPGHQHDDLRYNLQYGLPLANPMLASVWRRELNRAAEHVEFDYPDAQGLAELRGQICDYLARRRGVPATPEDVLLLREIRDALKK